MEPSQATVRTKMVSIRQVCWTLPSDACPGCGGSAPRVWDVIRVAVDIAELMLITSGCHGARKGPARTAGVSPAAAYNAREARLRDDPETAAIPPNEKRDTF